MKWEDLTKNEKKKEISKFKKEYKINCIRYILYTLSTLSFSVALFSWMSLISGVCIGSNCLIIGILSSIATIGFLLPAIVMSMKTSKKRKLLREWLEKNNISTDNNSKIINNVFKIIFSIIMILIIGSSLIFAVIEINHWKEFDKKEEEFKQKHNQLLFISKAILFEGEILNSATELENIGNDISSEWYDAIYENKYDDINDAVDTALSNNSEKIKTEKENKSKITKMYSEVMDFEVEQNTKNSKIKDLVDQLYDNYLDFYNLITNPSGNYSSFKTNFQDVENKLITTWEKLNTYLE